MVQKTISAAEAGRDFSEVLEDVATRHDSFIVEADGKQIAAVVPIGLYESVQRLKARAIERMEEAAANANLSEEEAERLIDKEIVDYRAEQRVP